MRPLSWRISISAFTQVLGVRGQTENSFVHCEFGRKILVQDL